MRIWHQGLNATNRVPNLREKMEEMARRVAPGLQIDFFGLGGGRGDADKLGGQAVRYLAAHRLQVDQIIRNARQAEREGYEAFIVGSLQDPGLMEARTLVDIPVIGYGQTAMHFAGILGRKAAILAFNPDMFPLIEENLQRYQLTSKFVPTVELQLGYGEIGDAFVDDTNFVKRFMEAGREALALGADVLIPGQALLCEAAYFSGITEVDGAPVLNVRALCFEVARMMVVLKGSTGLDVSRRGYFGQRVPEEILSIATRLYSEQNEDPRAGDNPKL